MLTNHWREIFDPAAQIFLNSIVASDASLTEATGARAEHPLVARRIRAGQQASGTDNPTAKLKFPAGVAVHPRPR